jgi:hypothetical protein
LDCRRTAAVQAISTNSSLPYRFPSRSLCAVSSTTRVTRPSHLIALDLITLALGEACNSRDPNHRSQSGKTAGKVTSSCPYFNYR